MKWRINKDEKPIKPWRVERIGDKTVVVHLLAYSDTDSETNIDIELDDHEARLFARDLLNTAK